MDGAYEIADADRKTFFTKAGRPVKDGGGVLTLCYCTLYSLLSCVVLCCDSILFCL